MFDRTYVTEQHIHPVHEVTKVVQEHRAPTDDSIRLANEYEQKIIDSICFKNYYGTDTGLSVNVTVRELMQISFDKMYIARLDVKINGKMFSRSVRISQKMHDYLKAEAYHSLYEMKQQAAKFIFYNVMIILSEMVLHSDEKISAEIRKILEKECNRIELLDDNLINW